MNKIAVFILITLTLFLTTGINLYSQEPPPPVTQGQVQPRKFNSEFSIKNNIETKDKKNTTKNTMPSVVRSIPETNRSNAATKNGYEENCDSKFSAIEDDSIIRYTYWLMIFTGLLVLCNILLWLSTNKSANAAKKSIELTKQEFITTHRPTLRVHSICLKKSDSIPKLNGGSYITHQLHYSVDNIGGSTAIIIKKSLTFKRLNEPLPVPFYRDPLLIEKTIACGESITESFGVEDVLIHLNNERGVNDLYFFGYIDYRDSTRTTRRTAFCRRYIRETKRFIKIEDEDYEYSY